MTSASNGVVYTIGHSTHSLEAMLALLRQHDITALADIRSMPYSKRMPQFNREFLKEGLSSAGITYVFLGRELGGRGIDVDSLDASGRVQYDRVAETPEFKNGLTRVASGSVKVRLALLCAERDPMECHRGLLVSRHLVDHGVNVLHIHWDGRLESHRDAEVRLLRNLGLHEPNLFRSDEEVLAEAYERQANRVSYVAPQREAKGTQSQ